MARLILGQIIFRRNILLWRSYLRSYLRNTLFQAGFFESKKIKTFKIDQNHQKTARTSSKNVKNLINSSSALG
jgi:hypothetical protein